MAGDGTNGKNRAPHLDSALLIVRTSNDMFGSAMTETSMRRSARLGSETLAVTRRDYIPIELLRDPQRLRSATGPGPVGSRWPGRPQADASVRRVRGPLTAQVPMGP